MQQRLRLPPLPGKTCEHVADAEISQRCGHVAIVGRPSVGKSTLLNALVGARISITSKKPQTTRHRISGICNEPGVQYVFVDTPGFQTRHASKLHARLNRAVADLLPGQVPVIVALNKTDTLKDKRELLPRIAEIATLREFAALVPISA